jgi:phosphate transport system substrate-binding protein
MTKRLRKTVGFGMAALTLLASSAMATGLRYKGAIPIARFIILDASRASHLPFSDIDLQSSSAEGFRTVMEGGCDIAGIARALNGDEKRQRPYYQIIGYDAIAIFANNRNNLTPSKEQLKAIFTGRITNWKDIGGSDAPILVALPKKSLGRALTGDVRDRILDGQDYGPAKEFDTPEELVKFVADNSNAIGYDSFSYKTAGVKFLPINKVEPTPSNIRSGAYLLSRALTLVAKDIPSGDLKRFFDFLMSPAGQSIVARKFIAIK